MTPIVLVFPGQGSQRAGMGKDFYEAFPESRLIIDEASEALLIVLREICFGEDPRLGLTEYTEPGLVRVVIAMVRALEAHYGVRGTRFGGHSLGEYAALVAAGVLPLADAVRLVRERGRRMQEAVPAGQGAMAAVMRADLDLSAMRAVLDGLSVDVANHNAPDQVVISGLAADFEAATARLLDSDAGRGARIKALDVSAPFHSRLMKPIEPGFRALLQTSSADWHVAGAAAVVSNYTGAFHEARAEAVVDALTRQISGAVRWVDNMVALIAAGPSRIVEIGPNRPLRGFFRALDVDVEAVFNTTTARRVFEAT